MWRVSFFSMALALSLVPGTAAALKEGECEVCVTFLGKFYESLKEDGVRFNTDDIKKALVKSCSDATGKDNRFCYYIGVTSGVTRMINEVTRLLSAELPVESICKRLKIMDPQICDLKYTTTSSSSL
ncbi:mesencephalic astrocyte-derived neurotrophic factor-like [Synchiropus splendidus]|uniref:mesencephalic astrocyte-derived neurotrophic factor-like n=1 Tax=Synchiropus splendidus TaxID=270530 RepID=UPI00237EBC5E|nr:mesencephalic astrocyte-derived neurotrophic factor-like [Synchiropus splendidus]XP_053723188.1 mesencephalic astrocyte-derived neurotrophic factor-like [Synchiropus splendidus]